MSTWQLALVIWLITGVTIAGSAVLVVLTVPQLSSDSSRLIPVVAAAGFAVAWLVSWVIAKQINRKRAVHA